MKKRNKIVLLSSIIFLVLFAILALTFRQPIITLDKTINTLITSIQNPFFIKLSAIIGFIFDIKMLTAITLMIVILLFFKNKKDSTLLAFGMLAGASLIYSLKEIIQRARPLNSLINETGFSFPSGHAVSSLIFFGLLYYIFKDKINSKALKIILLTFCILFPFVIGFSRLYLNTHWITDIIGGFALGVFILTASILIKELFD